MKRQQQQDSIDPSSRIDSDLFKDPLKQRESEHEQEWKFRQVLEFWMIFFLSLYFLKFQLLPASSPAFLSSSFHSSSP
jgi:hypothetical protein